MKKEGGEREKWDDNMKRSPHIVKNEHQNRYADMRIYKNSKAVAKNGNISDIGMN